MRSGSPFRYTFCILDHHCRHLQISINFVCDFLCHLITSSVWLEAVFIETFPVLHHQGRHVRHHVSAAVVRLDPLRHQVPEVG